MVSPEADRGRSGFLTVDAALESLAANFARKRAYAKLLVHDGLDGILVIAEEAWEQVREGIALQRSSQSDGAMYCSLGGSDLLGALRLARTLSFAHCRGGVGWSVG
jgi:hypothetical protein